MDGHCQRNCQHGDGLKHNSPLSCHHPADTRPRHPNVSHRFWCMIQTHAHENKIHIVPAQRNLLFPRFGDRPAKKPAHPRRNRGVEADQRPQRGSPPAGAQSTSCPRVSGQLARRPTPMVSYLCDGGDRDSAPSNRRAGLAPTSSGCGQEPPGRKFTHARFLGNGQNQIQGCRLQVEG